MRVLVITNMYPSKKDEILGIFIKDIVTSLKEFENIGSVVVANTIKKRGLIWTPLKYLLLFIKVLNASFFKSFDVIYTHDFLTTNTMALIPKYLKGKKLVATGHGADVLSYFKNKLFRTIVRFSLNRTDKIIVTNSELKSILIRELNIKENKIDIIPCGIDLEKFKLLNKKQCRKKLNLPLNKKILFHLSRLSPEKKVPDLIKVFSLCRNKNALLIIGGSGSLERKIRQQTKEFKLNKKIIFTGTIKRNKVPLYMNASDLFILPSENEGAPVTIMESLACGTPVIASNVGGIPEMIINEKIGLLVKPNDINDLKNKINLFLEGKTRFDKKEIVKRGKEYSLENIVGKIKKVYESIL